MTEETTLNALRLNVKLERDGELIFEFPKNLQHPVGRVNLTAAYLLEYWANKGVIPRYDGVIDGLRDGAAEIFKVAKPVRSNAPHEGPGAALSRTVPLDAVVGAHGTTEE